MGAAEELGWPIGARECLRIDGKSMEIARSHADFLGFCPFSAPNLSSGQESFTEAFPEPFTSLEGPEGEVNVSVRLLIKTQVLSWSSDDPNQAQAKSRPNTSENRRFWPEIH